MIAFSMNRSKIYSIILVGTLASKTANTNKARVKQMSPRKRDVRKIINSVNFLIVSRSKTYLHFLMIL